MAVGDVSAASYSDGTDIEWQAGYQPRIIGYRIYREVNGEKVLVSPDLIAGPGLLARAASVTAGQPRLFLVG